MFWLVVLTALPAVLSFLVLRDALIDDAHLERDPDRTALLRGLALGELHGAGRWRTGLFMASRSVALVTVAIALGG